MSKGHFCENCNSEKGTVETGLIWKIYVSQNDWGWKLGYLVKIGLLG